MKIMAINYFTLKEGVLELHFDKLVIFDDAKKNRFSNFGIAILGLMYSITGIIRGYKEKDTWWFYFGVILSIFLIYFLISKKKDFQRIDNEIYLKDISEVSFKGGKDDTTIATIMTRKKRTRKVIIENLDNLATRFKSDLEELNIKVKD